MKIKYFCSWWGLDGLGLRPMLEKVKGAGYDGIEIGIPADTAHRRELRALLDEYQLDVIAHQYQAAGETFDDYVRSFERWIDIAASFEPLLVNSHTGRDCWTRGQNLRLVAMAQSAEQRHGIPVLHESHRRHFLYSAPAALEYFQEAPNLMITADLAHWVCVAESLLVGHEVALEEAIRRAGHIHARVGFAEGPQVPDPFLPTWNRELTVFSEWWLRIAQRFRSEGKECLTVTLEYGPPPYGWVSLGSGEPLRDFFEMNLQMKDYLGAHFQKNLNLQP
jgi:sugar phosphate isomerase/epimerase